MPKFDNLPQTFAEYDIKPQHIFNRAAKPFGAFWLQNEAYHSSGAVSASKLKNAYKSLAHYLRPSGPPTPAMEIGTAVHTAILEPWDFDRDYMEGHSFKLNSKDGIIQAIEWAGGEADKSAKMDKLRADYAEQLKTLNKRVLEPSDWKMIQSMVHSVADHDIGRNLFEDGFPEVSLFGEYPFEDGLWGSVRPDYLKFIGGEWTLISVKTTMDASPDGFSRQIANLDYALAESFYVDFIKQVFDIEIGAVWMMAVQNKEPYITEIYELGQRSLERGREQFLTAMAKVKDHQKGKKIYKGYTNGGVMLLDMPPWALR